MPDAASSTGPRASGASRTAHSDPAARQPDPVAPHIVIEPSKGLAAIRLREIWEFRDLFFILAARDIKLRYKQTALGIIWVILQPLVPAIIFALIFGRLVKLSSDGAPYVVFVLTGLLPWNLFAGALQRAGNSLVTESRLVTKVYFPRIIIPAASAAGVLVDFMVSLGVLGVLMVVYGVPFTPRLLVLPLLTLVIVVTAIGVSLWFSSLNVRYRDFSYVLPFLIQVWMYGTPVVYSASIVPERWRTLYSMNPLAGCISVARWGFLGAGTFPWLPSALSLLMALLAVMTGVLVFRRAERSFADVI